MTRPRRSFLLCAVLVAVTGVTAQRVESFVDWASTRVLRLDTVEQRDDVSDLRPVLDLIGGARVVALVRAGFTFEVVSPGSAFDALMHSPASTPARAQSQP